MEHTVQPYFPSTMRTGILLSESHAPRGSDCLTTQNYFNSQAPFIFRAASQNPIAVTHLIYLFLDANFLKEI